jgi:hypothetical protein
MVSRPTVDSAGPLEAIEAYFENGWTDGLPVVPPTEAAVRRFIERAGREPQEVLLTVSETGRQCTVEAAAINAVMAGCKPEYFPVVVAALEGWADPRWGLGDRNYFYISIASTGGSGQLLIVNGPLRNELSMNYGVNVFGAGNRANATIGRTMRLIILNVLGMTPGVFDMSVQGHPGKYSYCIAENEEESPWEPLHVEKGFSPTESTVTVVGARGPVPVGGSGNLPVGGTEATGPEGTLALFARAAKVARSHAGTMVVAMCPQHADIIAKHGWNKRQVKEYLFEATKEPLSDEEWQGGAADQARQGGALDRDKLLATVDGVHYRLTFRTPDDVLLIVTGGNNGFFSSVISNWSYWIPPGDYIIKPIKT